MIKAVLLGGVAALAYVGSYGVASAQLLYVNDFNQNGATGTNTSLSVANWTGTTHVDGLDRVYQVSGANWAVWSYNYQPEAFYTAPGELTPINIATTQDLTFSVDLEASYNTPLVNTYFAVELSNDQWYVSATPLAQPTSTTSFTTETMSVDPSAAQWNLLNGIVDSGTDGSTPSIGSGATSDLSGNIIAAGVVTTRISSDGTVDFDNFKITGTTEQAVPEPSAAMLLLVGLGGVAGVWVRRRVTAKA